MQPVEAHKGCLERGLATQVMKGLLPLAKKHWPWNNLEVLAASILHC